MNIADYIDDYMAGRLSESDKTKFETLLKDNTDARDLVKNYKAVQYFSDDILEHELLSQVKQKVYGERTEQAKSKSSNRSTWIVAAAIMLGLVLIYFFLQKSPAPQIDKQELLIAFYEKPIFEDKVRSTDRASLDLFSQGKYDFGLNDFVKSEATLRAFLNSSLDAEKTTEANYWLAHALFNQEKYETAEGLFKNSNYKNSQCLFSLTQVLQSKADRSQLSEVCK